LTDEAAGDRITFASDSEDLGMTTSEEAQESERHDRNAVWYSKLLHDLTLCRLATRLRSYDFCVSVCQSWLSEFSSQMVVGAMAVAFGCFDCVSHLRKRKPDRSLLSSQVVMSLAFDDAMQPVNNAVSLVLKGGEALCYAWNEDYAQALSSFEAACKCTVELHKAFPEIHAAALILSFDQMAKLVCKAAEIKHRSLIDKYKIAAADSAHALMTGSLVSTEPASESSRSAGMNVELGLTVTREEAGWMIIKVALRILHHFHEYLLIEPCFRCTKGGQQHRYCIPETRSCELTDRPVPAASRNCGLAW
jgi:hypothetical protein